MTLAIWHGNLWRVGDTDTPGHPGTVELTTLTRITVTKYARLGDPGLILDPTDSEAADYCHVCGSPTDQPGAPCGSCGQDEDDARDGDAADMREYYREDR